MILTLGAATAVLLVLSVALGTKLIKVSEKARRDVSRLNECFRQRRRMGRQLAEYRQKLTAATSYGLALARERDQLLDAKRGSELISRQFQKLSDKHSVAMDRLAEIERNPRYKDGCIKDGAFRLESDARTFADYLEKQHGEEMKVYPCPQCREYYTGNVIYHVGHKSSRALRMASATGMSAENIDRLRAKIVTQSDAS